MRSASLIPLLILSALSLAARPELQASLTQASVSGWNCNPEGGAAIYSVQVFVQNTYDRSMYVNYSYYDFADAVMVSGGRACILPPQVGSHCSLRIPVRLGGAESGNTSLRLELTGIVDGVQETPSKTLEVMVNHRQTSSEARIGEMIRTTNSQVEQQSLAIASACSNGVCCGMVEAKQRLSDAQQMVSTARSELGRCAFTDAIVSSSAATLNVRLANESYNALLPRCSSALALLSNASSEIARANATILSRAACGVLINASRAELLAAAGLLEEGRHAMESDSYDIAAEKLNESSTRARGSLDLSSECPASRLSSITEVATPEKIPTPTQAPQEGTFATIVSYLGYLVVIAIVVVAAAAVYVSWGKRVLEGAPPAGRPSEPYIDHAKIDREFQEWLKQTEKKEKKK